MIHNAPDHQLAASFDTFRNGNFTFARQKLYTAHLAKIHTHRIIGSGYIAVRHITGRAAFAFFAALFATIVVCSLYNRDSHLAEA